MGNVLPISAFTEPGSTGVSQKAERILSEISEIEKILLLKQAILDIALLSFPSSFHFVFVLSLASPSPIHPSKHV